MSDDLRPDRPGVLAVLRRRRALRVGLTQSVAIATGLLLGLLLPELHVGATLSGSAVQPFLVALGGGLVSFIALVFSLLFLVVQYGASAFTPRLTLFRDDPLVWRTFAVFVGVFVYVATAALAVAGDQQVTVLVPVVAVGMVIGSLMLARSLQLRALGHVQLNATLDQISQRGERVLGALYDRPLVVAAAAPDEPELPPVTRRVEWGEGHAVLRQLDLATLCDLAASCDGVVVLHVGVGDELWRGRTVLTVLGGRDVPDETRFLDALEAGTDRSFEQDPLLAFRLLTDIGLRALSPAVNDPATAVTAIGHAHDLLLLVADRDLDIGDVRDTAGDVRVRLSMPDWDAVLGAAVDEMIHYGAAHPAVRARLVLLLDDLAGRLGPRRRLAVDRRLRQLSIIPEPFPEPVLARGGH